MSIIVKDLTKIYGETAVFRDFCCEFAEGKVSVVLGSSGCGKTTLLNVLAGLTDYSGKVSCGKCSCVFQTPMLVEQTTVYNNLKMILPHLSRENCEQLLSSVGLSGYSDKFASTLSGGEKQRVALARAYAYDSDVILLDEPFSSLDGVNKRQLMTTFREISSKRRCSTILVTHDADEALLLGDDVYVMEGSPATLRKFPIDLAMPRDETSDEYWRLRRILSDF